MSEIPGDYRVRPLFVSFVATGIVIGISDDAD
jgi:hypothetical protein